jgi:hypothetical protein
MFLDCRSDGVDGLHRLSRRFRVGEFQAVVFFQGDDQLQRVHRIQSQAARPEQRLVIADLRRADLEHQIFNQHLFDLGFEFNRIVHCELKSAVGYFWRPSL